MGWFHMQGVLSAIAIEQLRSTIVLATERGTRPFIVTYCAAEGSTICSSRAWKPSAKLAHPLPKRASF